MFTLSPIFPNAVKQGLFARLFAAWRQITLKWYNLTAFAAFVCYGALFQLDYIAGGKNSLQIIRRCVIVHLGALSHYSNQVNKLK